MKSEMAERLLNGAVENTDGDDEGSDLKRRVWTEMKLMWRIAFPSILARVTSFGVMVVTQSFLGHVSELDLAAFALIQSILIRFVNGILLGMSSATETLCGQAFGAKQYHMMGIYLQRSWIVDFITATIMLPLFFFTTPLLNLLGEQADIAAVAGKISLWCIPFLYNFVFSLTIQMYLQAQLKNLVVGWLSATSFVFHVVLSWIFVYKLEWGIAGALAAMNISSWSAVIGMFVYIFGGWCPNTWKGFTLAAFADMWPVIKLSISSGVMVCLELWYNSILVLLAGYMENATVAISAFSICLNICAWEFMVCLGFLAAACVRVSNELGRGNAKAAKFAMKVILSTSIAIGVFFWILCLIFGRKISYLFTNEEEVADAVSDLSVLLAFSILLNSIYPVLSGVAVGAGLQGTVAIVNICCYYVIGIPLGVVLAYVAHLEVKGLWIGMLCGVLTQSLVLLYITWKTDWEGQVNKASERLNQWFLKPSNELN
ncbi:protein DETOXIFICATION 24 [Morus notabilis]|uniref:protein DETOXIFICATION 24 n=1 Tax=Morus notabilis TaxID=981085 RepID=UPI000CED18C1|nr:protein DETOXIFICATION 24 [Morus notabilis]XP_024031115.1 protein DETOXIFICATION 24 [Morus notabilis]